MAEYNKCNRQTCPCGAGRNCNWLKSLTINSCQKECSSCDKNNFCPFGDSMMNDWIETRKKDLELDIFNIWYRNSFKSSPTMSDSIGNG